MGFSQICVYITWGISLSWDYVIRAIRFFILSSMKTARSKRNWILYKNVIIWLIFIIRSKIVFPFLLKLFCFAPVRFQLRSVPSPKEFVKAQSSGAIFTFSSGEIDGIYRWAFFCLPDSRLDSFSSFLLVRFRLILLLFSVPALCQVLSFIFYCTRFLINTALITVSWIRIWGTKRILVNVEKFEMVYIFI